MILSKLKHYLLVALAIAITSIIIPFTYFFSYSLINYNTAYEIGKSTGYLAGYSFFYTSILAVILFFGYLCTQITKGIRLSKV